MNWARVVAVVHLLKYLAEYSTQRPFVGVVHLKFECGPYGCHLMRLRLHIVVCIRIAKGRCWCHLGWGLVSYRGGLVRSRSGI